MVPLTLVGYHSADDAVREARSSRHHLARAAPGLGNRALSAASRDESADDPEDREDDPDKEHHPVAVAKRLEAEHAEWGVVRRRC